MLLTYLDRMKPGDAFLGTTNLDLGSLTLQRAHSNGGRSGAYTHQSRHPDDWRGRLVE